MVWGASSDRSEHRRRGDALSLALAPDERERERGRERERERKSRRGADLGHAR